MVHAEQDARLDRVLQQQLPLVDERQPILLDGLTLGVRQRVGLVPSAHDQRHDGDDLQALVGSSLVAAPCRLPAFLLAAVVRVMLRPARTAKLQQVHAQARAPVAPDRCQQPRCRRLAEAPERAWVLGALESADRARAEIDPATAGLRGVPGGALQREQP